MFSTPTVVGDLLIVGSCNGMLRALDKNTAQVKWAYDIRKDGEQSQFHGDPLVTDELIILGTDGNMGHVYAFERTTGKVRWKYRVNERGVATDVLRLGNNLYAVTLGDELVCLDLKSGALKWSFRSHFSGQAFYWTSTPVLDGDRIYFGGLDGTVYALDAHSGKQLWSRELGERVTTALALRGNDLYVGTAKRRVHRLNATTGEPTGVLDLEAEPRGRMLATADSLLVFLGEDVFVSLDQALKKVQWSLSASKEWTSARPYLWRGNILAGDRRQLMALRPENGAVVWSRQFPGMVRGIGTTDSVLYVGTLPGPIYAYAPQHEQ